MKRLNFAWLLLALAFLVSCNRAHEHLPGEDAGHAHSESEGPEPWAVTAWGELFEIFAETDPLIAGQASESFTHVTIHSDFSPLTQGTVTGILRSNSDAEERFPVDTALRDGIFPVVFQPSTEGEFDLYYLVQTDGLEEIIAGGRVRVGNEADPGGLVLEPHDDRPAANDTAPTSFLKEQQWKTAFATEWLQEGELSVSVKGYGRVRPPAGGEVVITAPVDGVIRSRSWPFVGMDVNARANLFSILPRVGAGASLAALQSSVSNLEDELEVASRRLGNLEKLYSINATSERELNEARSRVRRLESSLKVARRDLTSAEALRTSSGQAAGHSIRAPFLSRVAEVPVSPGQFVHSGDPLARLVKTRPVWVELALSPSDAAKLDSQPRGLFFQRSIEEPYQFVPAESVKVIARSPEVDRHSRTVAVLLEIDLSADVLTLGNTIEAEVLLEDVVRGAVIPQGAIVDDGGVLVAYVQLDGESFARRELNVRIRQGEAAVVEGVIVGERLVTVGGESIRRSEMLSTGAPEGHVH